MLLCFNAKQTLEASLCMWACRTLGTKDTSITEKYGDSSSLEDNK